MSVKRTACTLTGAEADAAACFSHGRHFSLLPPHLPSLPLEGSAVLNDTPVACQIRGPTDPQGDRCPHIPAALAATYPLRCFAPQWARFDNRQSTSAPTPTLTAASGSGARGTSSPPNRQCYPPHFMRECIPPNLHDPQRAKGSLDRRSKRLSFPHFFLRRKKCGRRRPPPRQGKANSPPQRRKRALFVSDGDSFAPRRELLLSAVTKVAKSTA